MLKKFQSFKKKVDANTNEATETSDLEIIEDEKSSTRFKILKFCEDVRPCYFGKQCSKKSNEIKGRGQSGLN